MNKKDALERILKASEYAGASLVPSYAIVAVLIHFYPELANIELEINILIAYVAHNLYSLYKRFVDGGGE